jgi:cytochrome b subunit of formate dehydrogenase
MAHDCSIVAGVTGRHLFHGTLTFLAGLRGMSCVERKRIVMSFTIQTGFISF